jgi:hypothetical protein
VPWSGFVPRERKTANPARALGNVHRPAHILGVAAHHTPDHRLAEGACRIVVGERHASGGLAVGAIGVVNRKAIYQHRHTIGRSAHFRLVNIAHYR